MIWQLLLLTLAIAALLNLTALIADRAVTLVRSRIYRRRLSRHQVWLLEIDRDVAVFADPRPTLRVVDAGGAR